MPGLFPLCQEIIFPFGMVRQHHRMVAIQNLYKVKIYVGKLKKGEERAKKMINVSKVGSGIEYSQVGCNCGVKYIYFVTNVNCLTQLS